METLSKFNLFLVHFLLTIYILEELTLEEKYVDIFKDQLRHIYTELNANKDKANAEFQRQINEVETKLERLEERFINEEIKPDLYEKFSKKIQAG